MSGISQNNTDDRECGFLLGTTCVSGFLTDRDVVDYVAIVVHGLGITIGFLATCVLHKRHKNKTWHGFRCHTLRWLVTLLLLLATLGLASEAILADCIVKEIHYVTHVLTSLLFISTIISVIYYHTVEVRDKPRLLWLLVIYWTLALVAHVLRVFSMYISRTNIYVLKHYDSISDISIALAFSLTVAVCFGCLLVIEIYVVGSLQKSVRQEYCPPSEQSTAPGERYHQSRASFLSKATLWWLNELLLQGFRSPLEAEHLGTIPWEHKTQYQFEKFERIYKDEKRRSKSGRPNLWWCYLRLTWRMMLMSGLLRLIGDLFVFVAPWAISRIIAYIQTPSARVDRVANETIAMSSEEFIDNGYILSVLLFLSSVLHHTLTQCSVLYSEIEAVHLKAAIEAYIYHKMLRLRSWRGNGIGMSVGTLNNHLGADSFNLVMALSFFHFTWTIPLEIFITGGFLYHYLGYSALWGLALLFAFLPVQFLLAWGLSVVKKKTMDAMDERIKRTNELLHGIRMIKLYAWERHICDGINKMRSREIRCLLRSACVQALTTFVNNGVPIIVTLLSFTLYVTYFEGDLTAAKAFSSLALFNMLNFPLFMFPAVVFIMVSARVSTKRLSESLEMLETEARDEPLPSPQPTTNSNKENNHGNENGMIEMGTVMKPSNIIQVVNGSFTCNVGADNLILDSINVQISREKLTMIVGPVGCGKSSLLSAILGEMYAVSGSVEFPGKQPPTMAFCGQEPWLLNDTLRENILFGKEYFHPKYMSVIEACALQPDIEILPSGDQTEIGEKGIKLSGGQKQRVSLARALYSSASVVLIDDLFASLDTHVRNHVFDRSVIELLVKKGRTVVLVTHHEPFLHRADQVVLMGRGSIVHQGSLEQLRQLDSRLLETLRDTLREYGDVDEGQTEAERRHLRKTLSLESLCGRHHDRSLSASSRTSDETTAMPGTPIDEANVTTAMLVSKENREVGAVSLRVWCSYMLACGVVFSMMVLLLHLLREGVKIGSDFWLSRWATHKENLTNETSDGGSLSDSTRYYLNGYVYLSLGTILMTLIAGTSVEFAGLRGSRNLHKQLLFNIAISPVRFFDKTPLGRIINRFSTDVRVTDSELPSHIQYLLRTVLMCVSGIIVNAIVTPWFLVGTLPLIIVYYGIQKFYRATARELQRLNNITRSPVFAQLSETLTGLVTIRAYRSETKFANRMMNFIDKNNIAFLFSKAASVWLAIRLGYLASVVVLVAGVASISTGEDGPTKAGLVGLALTYAVMMSNVFNWVVQNIATTEMQMSSVERLVEYGTQETEPYYYKEGNFKPREDWPTHGEVIMEDLAARYDANLSPVLHDISLHIKPGEKVGICGRTGSGKSSLALALFRYLDIHHGRILIDGVDVKTVPLNVLRSRISIIPQDPVLFSGTVRFNLDPSNTCTDEQLWSALDVAQLRDVVANLPRKLEAEVTNGGDNFSVGQKQLFCLARAILRNSAILVMDEATASLDVATVGLIQEAMETAFADKTVITIAHRLSTILNYDTIVVLDRRKNGGEIVEQGTPNELLQNVQSSFYNLVQHQQLL